MYSFLKTLVPVMALALDFACAAAVAQTPSYSNVGRIPTQEEIKAWDISVGPSGKELPPGSGTAPQGQKLFEQRCAKCHGPTGVEVPLPYEGTLVGDKTKKIAPNHDILRSIGSMWPFATTVWDYIHRAMPRGEEGSLSTDEVYALTAYLLYRNDIIRETDVIDRETLPKIQMPNRNGFVPVRWEDLHRFRCPVGTCP